MPVRHASKRGVGGSAVAAALLVAGAAAASPALDFDHVFTAAKEPTELHMRVLFRGADGVHRMELWRDHDRRVKRVTDQAIVSLATHRAGEPGYQLTVLDLKKRIATQIDRTNLYRVGNFTDWFDLTHGLRHPKGKYSLTLGTAPAGMPASPAPCDWYRLAQGERTTAICWDAKHRVPLLIASGDHHPIWRVTEVDTKPVPAATYLLDIRGFTVNDANRDIERD